ncbi:translation initiation factor IF-2 [Nematostella vectensis]|uniref:translation initiation factor IF-2 n=1 Tax=Nematostella vectensis TaxID=45351 RepID=UPI0013905647|nr:translation initiation factor IF-2 [Nematostella vectensis]
MACNEKEFKLPKQRDFLPAKKYRDAVKRWGEPNQMTRKRVIIVPTIQCEERDADVYGDSRRRSGLASSADGSRGTRGQINNQHLEDSESSQEAKYKAWLAERKKLRSILNNSGLNQEWLSKKNTKTALEQRVLKRMKQEANPEIRVKKLPPIVTADDENITGVDKGVPTIRQPSPAALALIQEYLDQRRLRLVDLFAQADKDKNWVVTRVEFRNIIRSTGIPITESDLEDLIMALDRDDNDALDYRELASGRQSYLEERNERKSAGKGPPERKIAGLQSVKEEPETTQSSEQLPKRPSSPQRPKSPNRPASPQRPRSPNRPSSPQRPRSPNRPASTSQSPSSIMLDRPDSSPARPASQMSGVSLSRSNSSPSLLDLPAIEMTEKVERPSQDEMKEKRMKKQQKRKDKEKAKYKKKPVEKLTVAPSTLGGTTGEVIDRYRKLTLKEYQESVELCQMHGVPLSKAMLGRVILYPEDKPVAQCIPKSRKGMFAITTRHHVPASQRGSRPPITGPDWVT